MSGRRARRANALATIACCAGLTTVACGKGSGATVDAGALTTASAERIDALRVAEQRRVAGEVTPQDLQSRDARVRRAAVRALARIGDDAARPGLMRALADEDDEVAAWAAYGLGFFCKGHEKESVSALVAHGLARLERRAPSAGAPSATPAPSTAVAPSGSATLADPAPPLSVSAAFARAIGRCNADESEPTLVSWLAGPRERAALAAFALGDLAGVAGKLREETIVALLNLAAGSAAAPPVPEALYPIGRLKNVPPSVADRLREVAVARLAEPGEARFFAVRALGHGGDAASTDLGRVLGTKQSFTPAERAEAARQLRRLKQAGQRVLGDALPPLVPSADPVALAALVGDEVGILLETLTALEAPGKAERSLRTLAALPPPPSAPPAVARRVAWLRCDAAKVLAGSNAADPLLAGCDSGSIGARATIEVLGRAPITKARAATWLGYVKSGDARVREAALELVATHGEIDAVPILVDALGAKEIGVVAQAAEVLAKQPQRASVAVNKPKSKKKDHDHKDRDDKAAGEPAPAIIKALLDALGRGGAFDDPEVSSGLIDAAGALGLKQALPRIEELCRGQNPTVREHAARALASISGGNAKCEAPDKGGPPPEELGALARAPVTLTFDTDVGALSIGLDPAFAPVAVTRIAALARAGFYRNMVVHRVVPGFVTQFGSPSGDGYGGPPDRPPLRCETSPLPFARGAVGVALAGRDTGSSQIFIMHQRHPHLDGQYAWIGTATGAWDAFVDGDLIRDVKVSP